MKRWQTILLGGVVTVATLAWALNGNDLGKLQTELARGRYIFVVPCLILIAVSLFLRSVRWHSLLDGRMKLDHAFHILNASYLFNSFLPMRLGEVARAALGTRLSPAVSMFTSLSSVIVERLMDLLAVVVLVILAILLSPTTASAVADGARVTGLATLTGMVVLAVFAANQRLAHGFVNRVLAVFPFLNRFNVRALTNHVLDGIAPLGSLGGISKTLFWTAVAWFASVTAGFILLYVYYDSPTWTAALLMISSASIAIALPVSIAGVGPFEAAIIAGLTLGGMVGPDQPRERAVTYAVLLHATNTFSYALWGFIGLSREQISLGEAIRSARRLARSSDPAAGQPDSGLDSNTAPPPTV